MRKHWLATGLVIAVAALMIGAIACSSSKTKTPTSSTPTTSSGSPTASGSGSAISSVTVSLVEYKVVPNITSVPSGSVTFSAKNIGGTDHTLLVISTKLAQDALPTKADGSVDEKSSDITIVGKTATIPVQKGEQLTVKLKPGNYVLICNVVQTTNGTTTSHYAKAMHAAFTVTQ
jgi:hypothetical protein